MISGLRFTGYKSFIGEYADIDEFSNIKITVFIGRNNSGKSSCIDVIENLISPNKLEKFIQEQKDMKIEIGHIFDKGDIEILGTLYTEFLYENIGKKIYLQIDAIFDPLSEQCFSYKLIPIDKEFYITNEYDLDIYIQKYTNEFFQFKFRRLNAERNIVAEVESDEENVDANGSGVTNLVRKFLSYSELDESLIENDLLAALNKIVSPDSEFSNIKIQRIKNEGRILWEIFLQEGKNRYALSKMGSGLKTIILVLINLLVIPHTKDYKDQKIIYAFEELENNLHPALQRRLFDYLYDYSIQKDVMIFLTTHSHVAINGYCDKDHAQIYHVIKKNGISSLHKIDDYIAKSSLLNDLDVKASDLLQSNGIIWVEGPSDRVYIKKWLEIFSDDSLQEGRDYQILYYGGRLLAHYSADDNQKEELLNVLITNRNAAIVIDSDKRSAHEQINDTKKRVSEEFEKYQAFCWITLGKEIENYIPYASIERAFGKKLDNQCGQYELFPDYIKSVRPNFSNEKVIFAQKVCQYISAENSSEILDLKEQMKKLIKTIKKWNYVF